MERNLCLDWQNLVEEAVRRRKAQRLTQQELAILCGLSKPTINNFEQGKTTLTLNSAFKVLSMLGLLKK